MAIPAAQPAGMTLTEMAAAAGLTRAGARRMLLTLAASAGVRQDGRQFTLTPKLLSAGAAMARWKLVMGICRAAHARDRSDAEGILLGRRAR